MTVGYRTTILSALVLALASLGDAFLYPVLPVNAASMGVPLAWVGVLLSINRFIRLAANQAFGWLFNTFGYRKITILSSVFAALSTLAYGLSATIFLWLAARIIWGLCYSSLRISCIAYSLEGDKPGFKLGLSRGLQETGPILALLIGPSLLKYLGPSQTFIMFSLLSVSAIVLAFYLPELRQTKEQYAFSFNPIPSSFNSLVFLSALLVEGIIVVVIVKLLDSPATGLVELTGIAAMYIGYRRLSNVFVSPIAGRIADLAGIERVFLIALLLTIFSVVLIVTGSPSVGLILAFTFQSITSALSPAEASGNAESRLKTIATNATWRDLGSAAGALTGGLLLKVNDLHFYMLIATLLLFIAFANHLIRKKQFKALAIWR